MMKITAGLGSVDDYPSFVRAGADELFCGYVPEWWQRKYGIYAPLNRREVIYYNVQIGSQSEMEILHQMIQDFQVPVSIALNALSYHPDQYPDLVHYVKECLEMGFDSFIIADLALIIYLRKAGLPEKIQISVSGELGEMNRDTLELLMNYQVKRIIFHRKVTPEEMKSCIETLIHSQEKSNTIIEFEAFALNENCHFHGGFCNSLHCDELTHMCHVPYQSVDCTEELSFTDIQSVSEQSYNLSEQNPSKFCDRLMMKNSENASVNNHVAHDLQIYQGFDYIPGLSGCGFCALYRLTQAGITHLKLVGRGNYTDDMIQDLQALSLARDLAETSLDEASYIRQMKARIFPQGCSGNCYYRFT